MVSRRELLTAFAGIVTQTTVTPPRGFRAIGPLTMTDEEAAEGFSQIGSELALCVNVEGPLYPLLLNLRDREIRVTVEPT